MVKNGAQGGLGTVDAICQPLGPKLLRKEQKVNLTPKEVPK